MLSRIIIFINFIKNSPGHIPFYSNFLFFVLSFSHSFFWAQFQALLVLIFKHGQPVISFHIELHIYLFVLVNEWQRLISICLNWPNILDRRKFGYSVWCPTTSVFSAFTDLIFDENLFLDNRLILAPSHQIQFSVVEIRILGTATEKAFALFVWWLLNSRMLPYLRRSILQKLIKLLILRCHL